MPRLRVVQFLTCLDVGGTERHVATLARTLDPARFDVRVACLRAGGPLSEEVEAAGVPIDRYPISRLWGPATWAMQRRFAEGPIDFTEWRRRMRAFQDTEDAKESRK